MTEPVHPAALPAAKAPPHWVLPCYSDFFLKLKEEPEPERRAGCRSKRPLVPKPELTLEDLRKNPLSYHDLYTQFYDFDAALAHWVHANLIEFALACKTGAYRGAEDEIENADAYRVVMFGMPGFPGHRAHLEPSYALAGDREMTERNLNLKLRQLTGLTVREWWDAVRVRYTDVRARIRAEIDATLRQWARDNRIALPGQAGELAQLLKRARAAYGFDRTTFAMDFGFKNHARLNSAFKMVANMSLARWETALLEELAHEYAREHAQARADSSVTAKSAAAAPAAALGSHAARNRAPSTAAPPGDTQVA